MTGVWGSSATDVWVVGTACIAHWDGSRFERFEQAEKDNSITALWGNASNDVWAVGDQGRVLRWDGSKWSVGSWTNAVLQATDTYADAGYYLDQVWGTGDKDVWIVSTGGTIIHWDGSKFDRNAQAGIPPAPYDRGWPSGFVLKGSNLHRINATC